MGVPLLSLLRQQGDTHVGRVAASPTEQARAQRRGRPETMSGPLAANVINVQLLGNSNSNCTLMSFGHCNRGPAGCLGPPSLVFDQRQERTVWRRQARGPALAAPPVASTGHEDFAADRIAALKVMEPHPKYRSGSPVAAAAQESASASGFRHG
jgi:hypothetical protein